MNKTIFGLKSGLKNILKENILLLFRHNLVIFDFDGNSYTEIFGFILFLS